MNPQEIFLSDYKKPEFKVINIDLCFKLDPEKTIISSEIKFKSQDLNISEKYNLPEQKLKLHSATYKKMMNLYNNGAPLLYKFIIFLYVAE